MRMCVRVCVRPRGFLVIKAAVEGDHVYEQCYLIFLHTSIKMKARRLYR